MSAAPNLFRKPAQSEGVSPAAGHFPFSHDSLPHLYRISSGRAQDACVMFVMSFANRRWLNGRTDGWALLTTEQIAKMFKEGLLCEGNDGPARTARRVVEDGVRRKIFERKSLREAAKENLLSRDERMWGKDHPRGFLLRTDPECWRELPDYEYVAPEDLAPEEETDQADEAAAEPIRPEVIHITAEPLVLLPRANAQPLSLSKAVRRGLGRCPAMESRSALSIPVTIGLSIQESGNLQVSIGAAGQIAKGEGNEKANGHGRPFGGEGKAKANGHGCPFDENKDHPSSALAQAPNPEPPAASSPRPKTGAPVPTTGSPGEPPQDHHFDLSAYPEFVAAVRRQFPSTSDSLLKSLIHDCRHEAKKLNLRPSQVDDAMLTAALSAPGVTVKGQRGAALYYRARGEAGTLVRYIAHSLSTGGPCDEQLIERLIAEERAARGDPHGRRR